MSEAPVPSESNEFPPLLVPGRHRVQLEELEVFFADPFPLSKTRRQILAGLVRVIGALQEAGVNGDLWIDGSFVTQKIDPRDVDIVLRLRGDHYETTDETQKDAIEWLESGLRDSLLCDGYVFHSWPEEHEHFWVGEMMYAYWMRQWGFDRDNTMKGMAVIVIGDGAGYD